MYTHVHTRQVFFCLVFFFGFRYDGIKCKREEAAPCRMQGAIFIEPENTSTFFLFALVAIKYWET